MSDDIVESAAADGIMQSDRLAGRAEAVELPTGGYEQFLHDLDDPVVARYRGQRYRAYAATRTGEPFVQNLLAAWRSLYDEPFRGVTDDGRVRPDLYALPDGGSADPAPRIAAERVLELLTAEQRTRYRREIDAPEWRAWSNPEFAIHEVGLRLEDLDEPRVAAILGLVRASLSPAGFEQVRELMALNAFLGGLVDLPTIMNERSYFTTLYGTPSDDGAWGWQLFGHHVAINFVSVGGRHVIAPLFLGAEPAVLGEDSPGVFAHREDLAIRLASSFTREQRYRAVVYASVLDPAMPEGRVHPADERSLGGAFGDNRMVPNEGVRADVLDEGQRALLLEIVEDALVLLTERQRAVTLADVAAHLDETWFAWYGATDGSQPFYFRIQSPVILIELDHHAGIWLANRLPARFHVHTTLRLPNGNDYGKAYIAEHEQRAPGAAGA